VSAENQTLTVRAERTRHDPEGSTYLISERPSGVYSRQLVLGDGLAVEDIRAEYRDGVLTLTIPVAEQAKPRKIEIMRGEATAVSSHQGHKMISGETGTDQATTTDRQPAGATS
jgi:HSP20 family protein